MKTKWGLIVALSGWAACAASFGATLTWTEAVSSDLYNSTNWTPMAVPASGDTLNITNGIVNISPPFTSTGEVN